MNWIIKKFVIAVVAVFFVATVSVAEDTVPTIQEAPAPQTDTAVADDGFVDCFYEANAAHVLCQKTRAGVAIKREPKAAPSQTAVSNE